MSGRPGYACRCDIASMVVGERIVISSPMIVASYSRLQDFTVTGLSIFTCAPTFKAGRMIGFGSRNVHGVYLECRPHDYEIGTKLASSISPLTGIALSAIGYARTLPTTRSPTDNCVAPSYCVTGCRGISLCPLLAMRGPYSNS